MFVTGAQIAQYAEWMCGSRHSLAISGYVRSCASKPFAHNSSAISLILKYVSVKCVDLNWLDAFVWQIKPMHLFDFSFFPRFVSICVRRNAIMASYMISGHFAFIYCISAISVQLIQLCRVCRTLPAIAFDGFACKCILFAVHFCPANARTF